MAARGDMLGDLVRTDNGEEGGSEEGGSERSDADADGELSIALCCRSICFYFRHYATNVRAPARALLKGPQSQAGRKQRSPMRK